MTIITTQLDELWAIKQLEERVIAAKAVMQMAYHTIEETNAKVQAIVSLGTLNDVPTETKTALNKAWTALKNCQTAMQAVDVQEVLMWTGN
jgi:hypothetical protein